ncbi:hypothetical protein RhiirA4_469328 [Rhizophagus irregularis]|uniref:Uncharacterized protein n=1 Tax=Rhizophagus irregularis TaxID=588596 RepID=A0A2I1GZB9_9GLOM|nr:hypothetical protein RhiirA4_469328 [Rhizophagus irregularis]
MCKLFGIGEIDNQSLSSFPPSLCGLPRIARLIGITEEAIDAHIRVANQHGWAVPQGWIAKALIIKCSLDDNENQSLSKPVIIIYGDKNMEDMATKVSWSYCVVIVYIYIYIEGSSNAGATEG